ncbi:unnamed protein product, partial [Brassica oleracea]
HHITESYVQFLDFRAYLSPIILSSEDKRKILSRVLSARDGVLIRYLVVLQSLYCFFPLRRVASMIGTGNSYGSSGFSSSSVESKSASVVFHFGGESGSGTQVELMVPGRSGSCLRAGQWATQSSMAVSRSVSVLHLSFQHLLLVTILSLPIGLRPHLVWKLGLLCFNFGFTPLWFGVWHRGQASFVYSSVGAVASICLFGRRFQTLCGVAYKPGFGGARKAYGKYPELSPISRLAL